jgi:hypothetical protein
MEMRNDRIYWFVIVVLFVLYVSAMPSSKADSFEAHLASKHFGSRIDYNEFNPGLGANLDVLDGYHFTIGGYYGSMSEPIAYTGIGKEIGDGAVRFGADAGIVVGYPFLQVAPMVTPYISVGNDSFRLKSRLMPLYEAESGFVGAVITISMELGL